MWRVLAAWVLSPVVAPADPPRPAAWELQWTAPDSCPDADRIRERVAALVELDPEGTGTLYVDARIETRDDGFALTLATAFGERHDTREISATTCAELGDATALVVAVSLDPSFGGGATTSPSPPEPAPADEPAIAKPSPAPLPDPARIADPLPLPLPEPPPPRPAGDRPSTTSGDRGRDLTPDAWAIRLAPQLELGALPPFGGGFELAVALQWQRWHVDIHGTYLWPRTVDGPLGTSARLQQGSAGARGCWVPRAGIVGFPLCAGVDAGVQRADSRGLDPPSTVTGPWAGPSLGAGVTAGGRRIAFWSLLEATGALGRTQVSIGEQVVFRPSPVAGRLLAGLQISFAIKSR